MHRAALAALGIEGYSYQHLPVPPELFDETVRALGGAGFVGANVTIPHKEAALSVAGSATDRAREIGAANTLSFTPDGAIAADNTDAPGFIAALDESPRGQSVVVLGAGGSARAVAWALKDAGAAQVVIHNRTHERAERLAKALGITAARELPAGDMLVNCTPVGLSDEDAALKATPIPADALSSFKSVVDLVYRTDETPLIAAARAQGMTVVDGIEILVQQGALSFEIWTGRQPPLEPMREAASARADRPDEPRIPPPAPGTHRDSRADG